MAFQPGGRRRVDSIIVISHLFFTDYTNIFCVGYGVVEDS